MRRYATSKAALASLTREMAAEFGSVGLRVNSISPGEIDTSMLSPGTQKIVDEMRSVICATYNRAIHPGKLLEIMADY